MRGTRVGIKPNTPTWLAWRARGITATDTAAILGLSPYNSPFNLWWQKAATRAALAAGETLTEAPRSQRFQLGHDLEPVIARHFTADVLPEGTRLASGGCWQGKGKDSWLRATPDRVLYSRRGRTPLAVVEFKTDTGGQFGDDPGDGVPVIPVHYRAQLLHQMVVAGVAEGWLSVLTGQFYVRHYWVAAQPGELEAVYNAAAAFEDSLHGQEPPPVDGHEATAQRIRGQYRGLIDAEQELPAALAAEYAGVLAAQKAINAWADSVKNRVAAAMGDYRYAVTPDGEKVATRSVSWPMRPEAASYREALESLNPDFPFAPNVLSRRATRPVVKVLPARPKKPAKGRTITTQGETR
jgi:putative phage-type endonuclease